METVSLQGPPDFNLPHAQFRPNQLETIRWVEAAKPGVIKVAELPTGCHAKGQGILMCDGSIKKVEDIVVGDKLQRGFGNKGTVATVEQLHRGRQVMYKVTETWEGNSFIVNRDHVLPIYLARHRNAIDATVDSLVNSVIHAFDARLHLLELYKEDGAPCISNPDFTIESLGYQDEYYGFTLTESPYYILDNGIICHNSGKSSIAMAQSVNSRVVVLTKTKQLQQQYNHEFHDAIVLYGRSNYPCAHDDATSDMSAHDCFFGNAMDDCPQIKNCQYHVLKLQAHDSARTVLNYAYWMVTHGKWQPTYLVLDEAHNLSDVVLNFVGLTIRQSEVVEFGLPPLPIISMRLNSPLLRISDPGNVAADWLEDSLGILQKRRNNIDYMTFGDAKTLNDKRNLDNFINKISVTLDAMKKGYGDHWFLRSGPNATHGGPGFICKPKTARYDAPRYFFKDRDRVLAMSATIGNVEAFTTELGIVNYDFRWAPNQWPAKTREVWVLDAPPMGRGSAERDSSIWDKQAKLIYKAIKECPENWSGYVLVSRRSEAKLLGERLAKLGLGKRIYVSGGVDGSYIPTNQQIIDWQKYKKKVPNALCVNWWAWEGVNGENEEICVIAKVPFGFIGDEYERARMEYSPQMYRQKTAWLIEQGCGRVRRGDISDYNIDGDFRTMVCIADGAVKLITKYFSKSFAESLVDYKFSS